MNKENCALKLVDEIICSSCPALRYGRTVHNNLTTLMERILAYRYYNIPENPLRLNIIFESGQWRKGDMEVREIIKGR